MAFTEFPIQTKVYDIDGITCIQRDDVAALLADTSLTYANVTAGDIIRTRAEGFAYEVAASGATDQHVTTAGGVKLYVLTAADGTVNPAQFGAVGNGSNDDTTALQSYVDFILTNGAEGFAGASSGAEYRTTDTITFTGNRGSLDFSGTRIVPDAGVTIAVQFGTSAAILSNVDITRLLVDRETFSGATENIGILYKNVAGCAFNSVESRVSKYNHVLRPEDGDRVAYNTWVNSGGTGGVYNIWFDQQGTGFANENAFFGGRMFTTADTIINLNMPNASQANTNRFYAVCLEGNATHAIYCNSPENTFDNCRTEGVWTGGAVRFGPSSLRNVVRVPRNDQQVVDEGQGNVIESALFSKRTQHNNGRIVEKLQRISAPGVSALSGSPTAATTAGSKDIVVSSATGIALGDFLGVAGAITMARVEKIDGTTITLDTVVATTVASGALTRAAPPVLDVSDDFYTSGDSFLRREYIGRFSSSSYFVRGYSRAAERHHIDGTGKAMFAGGVAPSASSGIMSAYFKAVEDLTFGSIGAGSEAEQSITVTGANTSMAAFASPAANIGAGFVWSARVTGSNTVAVRVANVTSAAATPSVQSWQVRVIG